MDFTIEELGCIFSCCYDVERPKNKDMLIANIEKYIDIEKRTPSEESPALLEIAYITLSKIRLLSDADITNVIELAEDISPQE